MWILGILLILIGFGFFSSWDTFYKIIGLVMILLGAILMFSHQMLIVEENKEIEGAYKIESERIVIEKMREVTGSEEIKIKSNNDNKEYLIGAGDDIYEVRMVEDIIIYELRDNIVKLEKE